MAFDGPQSGHGERQSLLQVRPETYASVVSEEPASPAEAEGTHALPCNEVSTTELVWILAGLWSPVFLGALDG
jgi:hypothetical protein